MSNVKAFTWLCFSFVGIYIKKLSLKPTLTGSFSTVEQFKIKFNIKYFVCIKNFIQSKQLQISSFINVFCSSICTLFYIISSMLDNFTLSQFSSQSFYVIFLNCLPFWFSHFCFIANKMYLCLYFDSVLFGVLNDLRTNKHPSFSILTIYFTSSYNFSCYTKVLCVLF